MEHDKWSKIIVNWTNCLKIQDLKITNVEGLNVKLLCKIIKYLDNLENEGENDADDHYVIKSFLAREYPFCGHGPLETLQIDGSVLIASLLLHYSCIKTKDGSVREAMCQRLNATDQKAVMFFANSLIKYENITEKNIKDTMMLIPVSEMCSPLAQVGSPGWAGSPATPPGRKGRRSRRVMHLEAALETERFDRNYLQEELRRQAAKVQEMEKLHSLQLSEIAALKSELSASSGSGGPWTEREEGSDCLKDGEQRLRRELTGLEQELLKVVGDLANMTIDRDAIRKKMVDTEKELTGWRSRAMEFETVKDSLQVHVDEQKSQIAGLKLVLAENNKMLEEYKHEHQMNVSIECDDDNLSLKKGLGSSFSMENLGNAVVDVQLKEQINQNQALVGQIDSLQMEKKSMDSELKTITQMLKDCQSEFQTLASSNIELQNEMACTKIELEVSQKDLAHKIEELEILTDQNSNSLSLVQKHETDICTLNEELAEKLTIIQTVKSHNHSLEQDLEHNKMLIEDYLRELKDNSELINELKKNIKFLENNNKVMIEDHTIIVKEFHKSIELLSNEKTAIQNELQSDIDSYKQLILQKENQLESLNTKYDLLAKETTELQNELKVLKTENEFQKNQFQAKQCEIETLSKNYDSFEKENEILNEKIKICEMNIAAHLQSIDILTTENSNFKLDVESKSRDIISLSNQVDSLKEEVSTTENKLVSIEKEKIKKDGELEIMYQEKAHLESTVTNYKEQFNLCIKDLKSSKIHIENLTKEVIQLRKTNDFINTQLSKTQETCCELENKILVLTNDKNQFENVIQKNSLTLADLEEKLINMEAEFLKKVELVALLEAEKLQLQQACSSNTLELETAKLDCDKIVAQLESISLMNEGLQSEIKSKIFEMDALQRQSTINQEVIDELKRDKKQLVSEKEVLSIQLIDLEQNFSVQCNRVVSLEGEIVQHENFKAEVCLQNSVLTEENQSLLSEIDIKMKALHTLQDDVIAKNSELSKLVVELEDLESNITLFKTTIEQFKKEVEIKTEINSQLIYEKEILLNEKHDLIKEQKNLRDFLDTEMSKTQELQQTISSIKEDFSSEIQHKECEKNALLADKEKLAEQLTSINVLTEERDSQTKLLSETRAELQDALMACEAKTEENSFLSERELNLKNQIVKVENINEELTEKVRSMENEILQFKCGIDSYSKEIELKDDLLANTEREIKGLSSKNVMLTQLTASLNDKLALLSREILELNKNNTELFEKMFTMENKDQHRGPEIVTLQQNLLKFEENIQALETEAVLNKFNNDTNSQMQITYGDSTEIIQEFKNQSTNDFEATPNASSEQFDHSSLVCTGSKQLIETTDFCTIIRTNKNIIAKLQTELIKYAAEYKTRVCALAEKGKNLEEKIAQLNVINSDDQNILRAKNLTIDNLSEECEQLKRLNSILTSNNTVSIQKMEQKLKKKENQIKKLIQSQIILEEQQKEVLQNLENIKLQLKNAENNLCLKTDEIHILTTKNKTLSSDLTHLEEEKKKQAKILECKELDFNSLSEEKQQLEQQQKDNESAIFTCLTNEMAQLQSDIILKENVIRKLASRSEDLSEEIRQANAKIEEVTKEKTEVIGLLEMNNKQLNVHLEAKTREMEVFKNENDCLQSTIDTLNAQIKIHECEITNCAEESTIVSQKISSQLQSYNTLKDEESLLRLTLSNVNIEFEKASKTVQRQQDELTSKSGEISQLNGVIVSQSEKLVQVEEKLLKLVRENEMLIQEKIEMEKCIDNVKFEMSGDNNMEDPNESPRSNYEDNSLDFDHVMNYKSDFVAPNNETATNPANMKINNLKSKLIQLCNSTEMISKTCAKNILQKDEIILKLTEDCTYLNEHIKNLVAKTDDLQQKIYDLEEENVSHRIDCETQINDLESLMQIEIHKTSLLDQKLATLIKELDEAHRGLCLSEQNEKSFIKLVYGKVCEMSELKKNDHSSKLKTLEEMLSKMWEAICEAVKRLKAISLPIVDEIFPPSLQLPIMDSLKLLNHENFHNSKNIFEILPTISSSIDYVDNYFNNLCKVIVSLVQDRMMCRDSLQNLEKRNKALTDDCQHYKEKHEQVTREMKIVSENLSKAEMVKEKFEKSLNISDTISSTTPSAQPANPTPLRVEGFIKRLHDNGPRLKNILSLQEERTNDINKMKKSLQKIKDSFYNYLGDKTALNGALNSHNTIEQEIHVMEENNMKIFNEIAKYSLDICLYTDCTSQTFKDVNNVEVYSSQDVGIANLEKQIQIIESESVLIEKNIPLVKQSLLNLETKNSSKDVSLPLPFVLKKKGLSVYEQMQELVENYVLIKEDLTIYETAKKSTMKTLKQMQERNTEAFNENTELCNKLSALRKVLQEMESKNTDLLQANEEYKYNQERQETLIHTEKETSRRTIAENTSLKKQVATLSCQLDELKSIFSLQVDDLKSSNERLLVENRKMQTKMVNGGETNQLVSDMRNEYEDKLTRMKQKMKQLYQEQIAVYTEKQKEETASLEALCKKYSEKIKRYEVHVNQLMIEQWKVGEKLLNEKKENEQLRKMIGEPIGSHHSLHSITSTASLPHTNTEMRRNTINPRCQNRKPYPSPGKDKPIFKQPHPNKAESGGLHMSDEEGEVFDNTYLTELRSGVCEPRASSTVLQSSSAINCNDNRLSELQFRNSLCLPHLKSSYPAELQFHRFKEEAIKMGGPISLDDSITIEKPRPKKEAGQTSYHKPGPPTPSKNGGRLSLQGNEIREPLKEQNDNTTKKATTPSRIKSLFMGNTSKSSSRDENTVGTPKGRRLSIFRRPR